MTTLVTGASGFVGSHLLQELTANDTPTRVLVHSAAVEAGFPKQGIEVRIGDVRDPQVLRDAVRGCDVVYHCAAAVGPAFSKSDIYAINLGGVRNVLDALRDAGAGRLIFVSTLNVLGTRNFDPATEEMPCRRSSDPAADVKIAAERLVQEYHARHGIDMTIVRPGVIYGPGDKHNLPKLVRAIERGKFSYIGSRDHVVPLVHVRDVVGALVLAGSSARAKGRTYHITDGGRTTIGELVDYLAELVGAPRPTKVLPYLVPYAGCLFFEWARRLRLYRGPAPIARNSLRFLGTSRYVDIGRARQELGYSPRVLFRQGVADVVRSLREPTHGNVDAVLASA
jgi:2-alkyl-3-oxoalkanoate reductase